MASLYQTPLAFLRPRAVPRPSTIARFLGTTRATSSSSPSASASTPISTHLAKSPVPSNSKPYRVPLTPSDCFPVYQLKQRGGNKLLTRVKNIQGDIAAFKTDLQKSLAVADDKEVVINQLTGHIVIKGHRKKEVTAFLVEHGAWCKEGYELL
ncbi:uncharacterized protein BP5553_09257 [Venustampulla echinocandica]|uniref:Large ribosomal subunit protein mL49 n=1 Tax=Venustampulla echinocandica TaxID=2656787 RepID=A0A370TC88_9HELO|nr:uncharacterized protein BP5553_09257 [Venustampulla echinocandica]RDL31855.1 hypothetical protein BP5553_09257 [Venustampulla echinocandica]